MEGWKAMQKWPSLQWWTQTYGHRTIPVELGTDSTQAWRETTMLLHTFITDHMQPSVVDDPAAEVAYIAQHPLFDQMPSLLADVEQPDLMGGTAMQMNTWIGTKGTVTPLHFDSYDNFLAQVRVSSALACILLANKFQFRISCKQDDAAVCRPLHGKHPQPGTSCVNDLLACSMLLTAGHKSASRCLLSLHIVAALLVYESHQEGVVGNHERRDACFAACLCACCVSFVFASRADLVQQSCNITVLQRNCDATTYMHAREPEICEFQVGGIKYLRLYSRKQTRMLYVDCARASQGRQHQTRAQRNVSAVNVEHPDLNEHPEFANAAYSECILCPGDMLFIPAKYWHYVRSLTPAMSVNFWY